MIFFLFFFLQHMMSQPRLRLHFIKTRHDVNSKSADPSGLGTSMLTRGYHNISECK